MGDDQAAALRILTWVGGLGERGVAGIPRFEEGVAALLYPPFEVGGGDLVGEIEQGVGRIEQLDRDCSSTTRSGSRPPIERGSGAGNVLL